MTVNDFDNPPPEQLAVECGSCDKFVSAVVVGQHSTYVEDAGFWWDVLLARCPACGHSILVGRSVEVHGPSEVERSAPQRLWPLPARELSADAAVGVRRDFAEAQRCMTVNAYTAAAVMARRVLEGIAADLGATGRSLAAKLTSLQNAGAIDGRLVDWADALRIVGNEAAHEVDAIVSHEDATDVLSFAEALADYVYTFRSRYKRFLDRRGSTSP